MRAADCKNLLKSPEGVFRQSEAAGTPAAFCHFRLKDYLIRPFFPRQFLDFRGMLCYSKHNYALSEALMHAILF